MEYPAERVSEVDAYLWYFLVEDINSSLDKVRRVYIMNTSRENVCLDIAFQAFMIHIAFHNIYQFLTGALFLSSTNSASVKRKQAE